MNCVFNDCDVEKRGFLKATLWCTMLFDTIVCCLDPGDNIGAMAQLLIPIAFLILKDLKNIIILSQLKPVPQC